MLSMVTMSRFVSVVFLFKLADVVVSKVGCPTPNNEALSVDGVLDVA